MNMPKEVESSLFWKDSCEPNEDHSPIVWVTGSGTLQGPCTSSRLYYPDIK